MNDINELFTELQKGIGEAQEVAQRYHDEMERQEVGSQLYMLAKDNADHAMRIADQRIALLGTQLQMAQFFAVRNGVQEIYDELGKLNGQLDLIASRLDMS